MRTITDNCLARAADFLTGDPRTPAPGTRYDGKWLESWCASLLARTGIYALRLDESDIPPLPDLEWIAITRVGDDLHAVACRGGSVLFDLAGGPDRLDPATVTHGIILLRSA
jgi:hypothetical protein